MRICTEVIYSRAFNLFLGSNMKRWKILIICIIMGLIFIPAVSAEEEYTVNSDTEDTFTSAGKDYIISPWVENSSDAENPIFSVLSTQYITQGQTKTHYVSVGSGINYLEVDLNWEIRVILLRLGSLPPHREVTWDPTVIILMEA